MDTLEVIAEPHRRKILYLVWNEEVAAMSIGGILLVVAIVVLFIRIKARVDEER